MARRGRGPDGACYYKNKLMGRCTVADGDAYSALMQSCGGDAARVLREYAYFSPELRGILEKVAAIQAKEARAVGIFENPKSSPWGDIQSCDVLCPGIFLVSTASYGGTTVAKDLTAALSPAARKCGMEAGGYLFFEVDCQDSVVLRDLLYNKLCTIPARLKHTAACDANINTSLL